MMKVCIQIKYQQVVLCSVIKIIDAVDLCYLIRIVFLFCSHMLILRLIGVNLSKVLIDGYYIRDTIGTRNGIMFEQTTQDISALILSVLLKDARSRCQFGVVV
jgi:hypothetical protein